jgi:predicted nucleic acid-binding protein
MIAVVDASAALKWQFADEEATAAATALLNDFIEDRIDLISPTLLSYEFISGINVAINRKRIAERDGYRAITYFISLGIELRPFGDLMEDTFRMSRKYSLSPYDCAYLSLAENEKCDLFTGDKKLLNAVQPSFPWVKWIGDYREQ